MMNGRVIARVGTLAVGLGIGAAMAAMPDTAAADSSTDWLSSIDSLLTGALPAADTSDLAISFDGITLLQEGSAHASSGSGDFAIADGADTTATATGTDDYAAVFGTGSSAVAGGPSGNADIALVDGDGSNAFAGGTANDPGTSDYSLIFGNGDTANAGGDAAGAGTEDVAYAEGNDLAPANAQGADYLIDIAKTYEDATSSTAAAESSNSLTDLVSSIDGSGATADASNLWTDVLSALDPSSAASDSTNLLTELASLF